MIYVITHYVLCDSRVVVGKTTSGLVRDLDEFVGIVWTVNLNDMGDHWSFIVRILCLILLLWQLYQY